MEFAGLARLPEPTEAEFARLRDLIHDTAGIYLADHKRALLVGRLAGRVRALGLRSYDDYAALVLEREDERVRMLDLISTNETRWFREPEHFRFLETTVLPAVAARATPPRVRVWSAGCSTGQEPYSVAMQVLGWFEARGEGVDLEVLATDLSTRVLEVARGATWPLRQADGIPPALLKRFMLRGTGGQEGLMRAGPALRRHLRFARLNLVEPLPAGLGPFDLVFCRNVLIYFREAERRLVLERLLSTLTPGGLLFLGHAETLNGLGLPVRAVSPNIYATRGGAAP